VKIYKKYKRTIKILQENDLMTLG